MKTIILADNQDITRAGILYICEKILGIDSVLEAEDSKQLLRLLSIYPDAVIVLDYTLFDLAGVDELIILQTRFNRSHWLLFSDELSEEFIRKILFSTETASIVMKDTALDEIQKAIHSALTSQRFISDRISGSLVSKIPAKELGERPILTVTEKEILKLIASGKTTKEVAAERFSSVHTVTTHRKNIFRKLGINNVHEATKYALRAGIIDSAEYYI